MPNFEEAAKAFLEEERIAVTGVSRTKANAANIIYQKLRDTGRQVYAVNPNAEKFDGDPCYPDLKSLPEPVGGVVIGNRPEVADEIVKDCAELGIKRVWMHRSLRALGSSVSEPAVAFCKENGIAVIPGGCPMWFAEPVDVAHKMFKLITRLTRNSPEPV